MNALWGLGHMMMLTRTLVVVDPDVDVQDVRAVAWFVFNNLDAARDLVVMPGPVDDLDHGLLRARLGNKSDRRDPQGRGRRLHARMAAGYRHGRCNARAVSARWREYGLGDLAKRGIADDWSGQGLRALDRLLTQPPHPRRPPSGLM